MKRVWVFFLVLSALCAAGSIPGKEKDFLEAEKFFFAGKLETAERMFRVHLQKNPLHSRALSYMGDIALQKKEYDSALSYYRQALELSDNPAREHFRIGQIMFQKDRADDAYGNFESAYRLDPAMKISLFQMGYVSLILKRDKEKTIENWQRFVDEAPNDAQNEKIRKVLAMLRDPEFVLPPRDSDFSLKEALMFGKIVKADSAEKKDKEAGHAKEKTSDKTQGLLDDADL